MALHHSHEPAGADLYHLRWQRHTGTVSTTPTVHGIQGSPCEHCTHVAPYCSPDTVWCVCVHVCARVRQPAATHSSNSCLATPSTPTVTAGNNHNRLLTQPVLQTEAERGERAIRFVAHGGCQILTPARNGTAGEEGSGEGCACGGNAGRDRRNHPRSKALSHTRRCDIPHPRRVTPSPWDAPVVMTEHCYYGSISHDILVADLSSQGVDHAHRTLSDTHSTTDNACSAQWGIRTR